MSKQRKAKKGPRRIRKNPRYRAWLHLNHDPFTPGWMEILDDSFQPCEKHVWGHTSAAE